MSSETAAYLASLDCVHCGLCIEHCPTYRHLGRESANPRGRIYLMRAVMEERVDASPDLVEDLDLCLVCRACESACPSGVRFGEVMAETRHKLRQRGWWRRHLMGKLSNREKLHRLAGLLRLWQRSGLRFVMRIAPKRLRRLESYLPEIPPASERRPLPRHLAAQGSPRGTVAVLEGCVMSVLFQDVNRDTMRLLSAAGYDVVVPENQTCCGALHEHDGDLDTTRTLLARNRDAFGGPEISAIVMNSSGCAAGMQGATHLLEEGGAVLADRVVDISRFLVDHGDALRFAPFAGRVTYDAPCHLHHAQREATAPLELLRRVEDLDLVPMDLADHCCGAAGIYNLDHPDLSAQILDEKLDALERTGASTLLTGNPGCIMQWRTGVRERGLAVEVLHPATFLAAQLAPLD
ncbi:MAG: hypothetical protein CMJ83_18245 [Planctomycetes bacterium]|nr:hypothetical protein [Planctomycetota bacterium]